MVIWTKLNKLDRIFNNTF